MVDAAVPGNPLIERDDKKVLSSAVRKAKWRLLPILCVIFVSNYIDRINIGYVRSYLEVDLGIGAAAYGIGAGLFYIPYFLLQVPANIVLCRLGARVWLSAIVMLWGVVSMLMAYVQNDTHFYMMRILLGAAEAGFLPGVMYYVSIWFPDKHRVKAVAWFLISCTFSSVVSGPLSAALLQLHGFSLSPWQWLFIVEGFASVVMGAVLLLVIASAPSEAKWLNDDERRMLVESIDRENQQSGSNEIDVMPMHALWRDRQYPLFCLLYFCIHLPFFAILFWLPHLIRQSDPSRSTFKIGCINAVPWLCAILAIYLWAACDRGGRFRKWGLAVALLTSASGCYLATMPLTHLAFIGVCLVTSAASVAGSILWSIAQRYADPCIAAVAFAMINGMGALAGWTTTTVFGFLDALCGSVAPGFHGLALTTASAAACVYLVKLTRGSPQCEESVSER